MLEKPKGMKDKAAGIKLNLGGKSAPSTDAPVEKTAQTSVGAHVQSVFRDRDLITENLSLKQQLEAFDDTLPLKKLDPTLISASEWANRLEESFKGEEFEQLEAEIESAGGNVQPIKVRPIPGTSPQRYEVVFGHRRHRACLNKNMPVLAMIDSDIKDKSLFEQMDRENRQRANPRAYEQGVTYLRALTKKMYNTPRELADSIGAAPSNVYAAVSIAKLPVEVLDAFPSRLDIQYGWQTALSKITKEANEKVIACAKEIWTERNKGAIISAADTFSRLKAAAGKPRLSNERSLSGKGGSATIKTSAGRLRVEFSKGALTQEKQLQLDKFISSLLNN